MVICWWRARWFIGSSVRWCVRQAGTTDLISCFFLLASVKLARAEELLHLACRNLARSVSNAPSASSRTLADCMGWSAPRVGVRRGDVRSYFAGGIEGYMESPRCVGWDGEESVLGNIGESRGRCWLGRW